MGYIPIETRETLEANPEDSEFPDNDGCECHYYREKLYVSKVTGKKLWYIRCKHGEVSGGYDSRDVAKDCLEAEYFTAIE